MKKHGKMSKIEVIKMKKIKGGRKRKRVVARVLNIKKNTRSKNGDAPNFERISNNTKNILLLKNVEILK